jgi:hypothetical protein
MDEEWLEMVEKWSKNRQKWSKIVDLFLENIKIRQLQAKSVHFYTKNRPSPTKTP